MLLTTASQMRAIDKMAIEEYGIPSLVLMECAGRTVAEVALGWAEEGGCPDYRITVVCGTGNNGGDGFVAARYLMNEGFPVFIVIIGDLAKMTPDADANLKTLEKMHAEIHSASTTQEWNVKAEMVLGADCVIDALFGTGFRGGIHDGLFAAVVDDINHSQARKLSVDLPSGLLADTGEVAGFAVQAHATVWLGYPKRAHVLSPSEGYCGELLEGDLGIPAEAAVDAGVVDEYLTDDIISPQFVMRDANTHKGSYGHLFIIGGSFGKVGAPALAAQAAFRCGAGLVTLGLPETLASSVLEFLPEAMTVGFSETNHAAISDGALLKALENTKEKSAVVLGPGLGLHPDTQGFVYEFIKQCSAPLVLDADALNALSQDRLDALKKRKPPTLLTPHPGEMSRLTGKTTDEVQADRFEIARQFAVEHNVFLLLKGYRSLLATPEGAVFVNSTGNPGMATAGMGDALAGIIGTLAGDSDRFTLESAACCGMYLHGLAGDLAAERFTEQAMTTSDLIACLPAAIAILQQPEHSHEHSHQHTEHSHPNHVPPQDQD